MGWFRHKPTQEKYVEAAVTIASNLFLHTIPEADDAPAELKFSLPDSRYRYLLFCLSAVVTTALVYDEKKQIQPEILFKGCLHFATWTATKQAQEYFDDPVSSQSAVGNTNTIFQDFLERWSEWLTLEKESRNNEIIDLICSMIHTTESSEPVEQADINRLGELALQIDCRLPTMRAAFVELANR